MPFWSPDSRELGFFAGVVLEARVGGRRPRARRRRQHQHIWRCWRHVGADGTIVFSGQARLMRVSAEGGAVSPVTKLPSEDWAHNWPSFLPDGRRFLFTAKLWTRTAEASDQGIYLGSLDSPAIQRLLPDLSSAVYAPPGYLVFSPRGHTHGRAVRSRRGTGDRPAGRDRRGRLDGSPVLLRGHLRVGRREPCGAAAGGGGADQRRYEHVQCRTARGGARGQRSVASARSGSTATSWRSGRATASPWPRPSSTPAPARRSCG